MIVMAVFRDQIVAVEKHRGLDEIRIGREGSDRPLPVYRIDGLKDLHAAVFGVDVVKIAFLPQYVGI